MKTYKEFNEGLIHYRDAEKLADFHAIEAKRHKQSGNASGYIDHADLSNQIIDKLIKKHPVYDPMLSDAFVKKSDKLKARYK